jgi:hypothetical protein
MHLWPSKKVTKTWSLWKKLPRSTSEEQSARNDLLINFGLKPEPKTVRGSVDKNKKNK